MILAISARLDLLTKWKIFAHLVNTALRVQNTLWTALVESTNHSSVKLIASYVHPVRCATGKSSKTVLFTITVKLEQLVITMMLTTWVVKITLTLHFYPNYVRTECILKKLAIRKLKTVILARLENRAAMVR